MALTAEIGEYIDSIVAAAKGIEKMAARLPSKYDSVLLSELKQIDAQVWETFELAEDAIMMNGT